MADRHPSKGSSSGDRIPVAVLGATGSVGQRFVSLLANHPWFELAALTASERSAGRPYGEVVQWVQPLPIPRATATMELLPTSPDRTAGFPLVFSALDAAVAGPAERTFADAGHTVVSNARSHRLERLVPLVVPEVNGEHLDLVTEQRRATDGGGAIVTNPNCSTIGLALALRPLVDAFGVEEAHVVTLQAVSGAGLPGVPALRILDNVIPLIPGEEEKIEVETRKILGRLEPGGVADHPIRVSAQCNRVPVVDGHTLCVSARLSRGADLPEVRQALKSFSAEPQALRLPSAPSRPIRVLDAEDAPQPRLHRDLERGMVAAVGRLRPCAVLDFKFVVLTHNTLRGAAAGALLVGEQIVARGLLPGHAVPTAHRT